MGKKMFHVWFTKSVDKRQTMDFIVLAKDPQEATDIAITYNNETPAVLPILTRQTKDFMIFSKPLNFHKDTYKI